MRPLPALAKIQILVETSILTVFLFTTKLIYDNLANAGCNLFTCPLAGFCCNEAGPTRHNPAGQTANGCDRRIQFIAQSIGQPKSKPGNHDCTKWNNENWTVDRNAPLSKEKYSRDSNRKRPKGNQSDEPARANKTRLIRDAEFVENKTDNPATTIAGNQTGDAGLRFDYVSR